jgi:hypothetical protein
VNVILVAILPYYHIYVTKNSPPPPLAWVLTRLTLRFCSVSGKPLFFGAWAWCLYRRCLAEPTWIATEFTRDLDCIGPEKLRVREGKPFDRFEANGFKWVPRGSQTPPVAHFAWPDKDQAQVEV